MKWKKKDIRIGREGKVKRTMYIGRQGGKEGLR